MDAIQLSWTQAQRQILWIALVLDAGMFVFEVGTGIRANSMSLVADGLDMLSDALVYVIALVEIGRGLQFKHKAAHWRGIMLLLFGYGLLFEVIRHFVEGDPPDGGWMMAVSTIALAVNEIVLRLLSRHRDGGVHLRGPCGYLRGRM